MTLERTPEYRRAARVALRWSTVYTRGLNGHVAGTRRDEIASDLHEHAAWAEEHGLSAPQLARSVRRRVLRGIPSDLAWRIEHRKAASPALRFVIRANAVILAVAATTGVGAAAWSMIPAPVDTPLPSPAVVDVELIASIEAGLQRRAATFAATVACMEDAGWTIHVVGTESFQVPGQTQDQTPVIWEDYRACSERTGWGTSDPVASDAQLSRLYDYEVATLECMEDYGVEVDPAPTRQAFIDRIEAAPDFWSAYDAIQNGPRAVEKRTGLTLEQMHEACPAPIEYTDPL
ncbi:hypothetical protein J2X63_001774 [Agromyces sp. 3263]|uniref:hypothetical protein n=1 Tax=Agromyces sp. 3263 TaxID=2817750 RepID=UPI0028616BE9|nr:hypothetical protein [Agromyces sp. 3263]MDR6906088.1 hypothetical protein [Agromyces sp. 3263]